MYENPLMDMPREHPVTASRPRITRREFARRSLLAGPVIAAAPAVMRAQGRRITTGVIGCGSVSNSYLPVLAASPHVELVSVCDIRPDRARRQAERFSVPHHYPHIDQMLAGAPFEFLVDLTDMQEHERLNRQALEAGRHVWSEKPIANSLAQGQELLRVATAKRVRLWGAPITVQSPQFAFMAGTIQAGSLGQLSAAHAHYGHDGPDWAAFFYQRGGGSMPDLAVYNLTTLTGLLGPASHVAAMLSIVTATRRIQERGAIMVEAEDNAMLLLDHGNGVISHVMAGFNYYNPYGHQGRDETRHTVTVIGRTGFMGMVGYDWEPQGVDVATASEPRLTRHATDAKGYVWQQGAALAAESLATGRQLLVTPEHALHVLEIITAARESQETGRRVALTSTFRWPVGV
jgi:predicted dehydrogenase